MEVLDSGIGQQVLDRTAAYDYNRYTADDVRRALRHENRTLEDFGALLSPAALPFLEEIAQAHGRPTVQAAINWVLKQPGITVALVGAKTPEQAVMNAQAADWELSDEENAKIEAAYAKIFE